ncbi:hypothetical protein [Archangium violaceum]|nr:hypothetical protein [Archangium violaceum]
MAIFDSRQAATFRTRVRGPRLSKKKAAGKKTAARKKSARKSS